MAELIREKPREEKQRVLEELHRVADEFEKVYDRYSHQCATTGEQVSCTVKRLIFPTLLRLYGQIDKIREMLET